MAWTAPRTWIAGETLTATLLNAHVRDNMLETEAALATGGGYFVGAALNDLVERKPKQATVSTSQTTTSTTYTNLATTGPAVTVTTSDRALVIWSANFSNNTAGGSGGAANTWMAPAVSGATTDAATDGDALQGQDLVANRSRQYMKSKFYVALTPGSNTFTAQYRVTGATTGTWSDRRLLVFPF
jgi:hypothetical protein